MSAFIERSNSNSCLITPGGRWMNANPLLTSGVMFTIASARMKELGWRYRSLAIRPVLAHSPRFCLRLNILRQTSCGKFKSRGKSSIRTARFLSATVFVDCTLPCVQPQQMESLMFSSAINGLRNLISKSHHWNDDRCPPCL